jgi:uncharacterized heparinase superfamily protein
MGYVDGLTDDEFLALVDDWIDSNPPAKDGYWLDAWNAWAVSIRSVAWMRRLAASPGLIPRATKALDSLTAQLRFLEHHLEFDVDGNHLVKDALALVWAGSFFEGDPAVAWHRRGTELLLAAAAGQVLPDGVHIERSPSYHAQVFADLVEGFPLLTDVGRRQLAPVLERMAQALADLTHPDGSVALFNDGGLTMAPDPARCMRAYGEAVAVPPKQRPDFALGDGGFYGIRDDAGLLVIDCGPLSAPHLPAHAHADLLSFEWSIDGQRVVVDQGVFEYNPGPLRDRSRSTAAHNTVTVDGQDQAEFWGAFRMGRRPVPVVEHLAFHDGRLELRGSHDGFAHLAGEPTHRRTFIATTTRVEVEDVVEGGAGQVVRSALLLHPDVGVEEVTHRSATLVIGQRRVRLSTDAGLSVTQDEWWPDVGQRAPALRLNLDYGRAPCACTYSLDAT